MIVSFSIQILIDDCPVIWNWILSNKMGFIRIWNFLFNLNYTVEPRRKLRKTNTFWNQFSKNRQLIITVSKVRTEKIDSFELAQRYDYENEKKIIKTIKR